MNVRKLCLIVAAFAVMPMSLPRALAEEPAPDPRETHRELVRSQALGAGLPPEVADAVATVESAYDPAAIGSLGEVGLMQVMPSTARMLGFAGDNAELAKPETNVRYGVTYLAEAWRLADKDLCTALMKYRAGHGETRFSYRSVDYCLRVRNVLMQNGYPVTGEVPKATFGAFVTSSTVALARTARGKRLAGRRFKSRMNWAAADARMKVITSRISMSGLTIMR